MNKKGLTGVRELLQNWILVMLEKFSKLPPQKIIELYTLNG